jgi:hypothetical protein
MNRRERSPMSNEELHPDLRGWWRITETSQWVNDGLDDLGPALISITGDGDRLRMHCLLAYVNVKPTKTGASFTWKGAWEYDQMSGTGSVNLRNDGKLGWRQLHTPTVLPHQHLLPRCVIGFAPAVEVSS